MAKNDKQAMAAKKKRKEKERQLAAQKKENTKKALKIALIVFIALCVALAIMFIVMTIVDNSGAKIRSQIFMETEHYKIDGAMMSYFIFDSYNSFKEYYASSISSLLDSTKDLKEQNCIYATADMGTGNRSWFDFFASDAEMAATNVLKACELAYKNNISLSEEDLNAVNIRTKETDLAAIGNGVSASDVSNCLKLKILANKYITSVSEGIIVSDEEIDKYYLDARDEYDYIEYLTVTYSYTKENKDKIDARVDALTKAADKDEFIALLRKYFTNDESTDVDASIDNSIKKASKSNTELTGEAKEWLFSAGINDSKTIVTEATDDNSTDKITVYFVSSEPAPDESQTRNVRHILFDANEYGSLEKAEKLAKNIYEKLQANNTLEYFKELVCAYSSDPGSVSNGGLYSNSKENTFVQSFNDWTFDSSRKAGDTDVLSSNYGYHVMYYEGDGLPSYKGNIYKELYNEKYNLLIDSLYDGITIERNPKVLNDIKGKI